MSKPIRLALLGDPVAHSRSPRIQRAALEDAGLVGDYVAIRAGEDELEQALDDLRRGRLHGVNITMPLKGAAAARADVLTPLARRARSVNTLRARQGRIEAHSTDAEAFLEISGDKGLPDRATLLVIGSGGSARAALAALEGRETYISARDEAKARALEKEFDSAGIVPWGSVVAGALVINATPIGMNGEELHDGLVEMATGLIDLPYGQETTPAVVRARAIGIPHVDGVEFLTRQAAAAFEWWTGVPVNYEDLLAAARNV